MITTVSNGSLYNFGTCVITCPRAFSRHIRRLCSTDDIFSRAILNANLDMKFHISYLKSKYLILLQVIHSF